MVNGSAPQSSTPSRKGTKRFVRHFKSNSTVLLIAALGGAIVFSGQVAGGIKAVYEIAFPKPDALALAREGDRENVSREFVGATWKRLFRSRNFLARVQHRASSEEITDAWKNHLNSVEEISSRTMIYAASFSEYYGELRRYEYEAGIQTDFNKITNALVDFRYSRPIQKLEFPSHFNEAITNEENSYINKTVAEINVLLDNLQIRLYHFVGCFDKKSQTKEACKYGSGGSSASW
jgi:hypothetical protein